MIDHILGPEGKSNILPEGKKMYLFIQKVLSEQLLQASLCPGSITVVNKKHRMPISAEFRNWEKKDTLYPGNRGKNYGRFFVKYYVTIHNWNYVFKETKYKPVKVSFKNEIEIQTFSNKQKQRIHL